MTDNAGDLVCGAEVLLLKDGVARPATEQRPGVYAVRANSLGHSDVKLIEEAMPSRAVARRDFTGFLRGLRRVLDDVREVAAREPLVGVEASTCMIGALMRLQERTHGPDGLEMSVLCADLCGQGLGLATRIELPSDQVAELIRAMMRAFLQDELCWFSVVPRLLVVLDTGASDPDWLARLVRSHMPAGNHDRQRELEWVLTQLGRT